MNGLDYRQGKLQASWCYRNFVEFPENTSSNAHKQQAGPNGPENNHDLNYAFSDDLGETWKNSKGETVAVIGAQKQHGLKSSIMPGADGVRVFEIPMGSGILNQESQAADWEGGFWVLNREKVNAEERWVVYRRDFEGMVSTSWLILILTFRRKLDEERNRKYREAHGDRLEGEHVRG
jgi:hypothetical protein